MLVCTPTLELGVNIGLFSRFSCVTVRLRRLIISNAQAALVAVCESALFRRSAAWVHMIGIASRTPSGSCAVRTVRQPFGLIMATCSAVMSDRSC